MITSCPPFVRGEETPDKSGKEENRSGDSTSEGDNASENKIVCTVRTKRGKNKDTEKEGKRKESNKDKKDGEAKTTKVKPDSYAKKYKRLKKLSKEKACERIKWVVDVLKKLDDYEIPDTKYAVKLISSMYDEYKDFRSDLSQTLVDNGYPGLSISMVKVLMRIGIFKSDMIWFPVYWVLSTWWDISDTSPLFAEALAEHGVITLLTRNLTREPFPESLITNENELFVIKSSMSTLHNIARMCTVKHLFDENKTSERIPYMLKMIHPSQIKYESCYEENITIRAFGNNGDPNKPAPPVSILALTPFLDHTDGTLKILSNLTVAYIVDEDTNKKQILGPETIEKIINWTDKALNSKPKTMNGFSPFELVDGLNKIAVNDTNKMTIVDKGAIPVLQKMLVEDDLMIQACACGMLWTLTFDKDVRLKIKDSAEVMALLETLKGSEDSRVQKNSSGALWVIKGENDITAQTRPKTAQSKQHVMLSYSWSDKEMVLQVKEKLQAAGYTIWIDVEKMEGSTLEAMADAIEHASVVLMCMSEKYKNSPNCRTEAEYTFQRRTLFIPLMMQKQYKPDGWLGIMLGAKLFFDFSGKYSFENTFNGLLRELHRSQNKDTPTEKVEVALDEIDGAVVESTSSTTNTQPGKRPVPPSSLTSSVFAMDEAKLSTWLKDEAHLVTCLTRFQKFKIDGKLLAQLIVIRSEAPEFFYKCLEKRLNMDMTEILQFTGVLDELSK